MAVTDRNLNKSAYGLKRTKIIPIPREVTKPEEKQFTMWLGGQKTTSAAGFMINKSQIRVTGVNFSLGATGGVQGTTTADIQDDGVSILSSAVNLAAAAAGSKNPCTLSTAAGVIIAADSVIKFNFVMTGGTAPTMDDVSATITYENVVATTAGVVTFYPEEDWVVLAVSAACAAKGGTNTVANIDVKDDGSTILTTKPDLAAASAGAKAAGVLTTTTGVTIASGSKVTVDFNSTNTNGTLTDVVAYITYRTKAGSETRN